MFEPELDCNPETDHEQAKDVWPLFQSAIELSKQRIIAEMVPVLFNYIDQHEKEEKERLEAARKDAMQYVVIRTNPEQ